MSKLQIANTFFEWELENEPKMDLREAFLQHEVFLQLQFLPVLYSAPEDSILLSDLPSADYWSSLNSKGIQAPLHFTLDGKDFSSEMAIESWGPSQLIASWAEKRGLTYSIPDWKVVREVNSKYFSFDHCPKLPGATLLYEESQAKQWLLSFPGIKVLKTCFGVSGKGHLIIENETPSWDRIVSFLHSEWKKDLPVIAEPWVTRLLDFSTQWSIAMDGQINYLGSTLCHNDRRGQYQYNEVGEERDYFSQLLEHRKHVEPLLKNIANKGFFGNLGIDAMLYTLPENSETTLLQPVVEINARKTMGWAALEFRKRYYPNKTVRLSYTKRGEGYLPNFLVLKNGKRVSFARNLMLQVYS